MSDVHGVHGTYTNFLNFVSHRESLQTAVHPVHEPPDLQQHQSRRGKTVTDHLLQTPTTVRNCPVCGKRSYYIRHADLLYHCDGSDNQLCQLQIARGAVATN